MREEEEQDRRLSIFHTLVFPLRFFPRSDPKVIKEDVKDVGRSKGWERILLTEFL